MHARVGIVKCRIKGVEIGMTELIIIHDDILEHFELHMGTVLGSVCLAFQQVTWPPCIPHARESTVKSVSKVAGLSDCGHHEYTGLLLNKSVGRGNREERAWHSGNVLGISLYMQAQFSLEIDEYSNLRLITA